MRWGLLVVAALLLTAGGGGAAAAIAPDRPVMDLDRIGRCEVGYAYRGQAEQRFPSGWSGDFDEDTGVACQPAGRQGGRGAFLLHCPWRGGTGVAFQEFAFQLPTVRRITLRGATALRDDIVSKSDGVTFRIRVNGRPLLETHRTDSEWQPFEYDLTGFAGQTVVVRFEADPGPNDDPSFDFSLWGDRTLVLEGLAAQAAAHPAPPPLSLEALEAEPAGVAPASVPGQTSAALGGDAIVLRYSGRDGELAYRWQRPQRTDDPLFGTVELVAQSRGDRPVQVSVAAAARARWIQPAEALTSRWERDLDGVRCVRTFRVGGDTVTLRIAGRLAGKSLVFDVTCDRPVVREVEIGGWGPVVWRQTVPVPYYSGRIDYLPAENLFVNAFLDWTQSLASSHEGGTRAVYQPLTDGRRNALHESAIYTPAWHLAEALPSIPNPASPYRQELGSRLVLDSWGGRFAEVEATLRRLAEYGIRDEVVLLHVWQRSGYDNALPAHVPANQELGGDPALASLVATGVKLGYRMALHENYVDYYPNYDSFDPNDISLDPSGQRVPAWYNPGTRIQSFAEKPSAILRLAATQSPDIHQRYGTNACFLDVHSAVPPWFHVDARAGEPGAGTFQKVWEVHRALWQYERQTHGGPVFGEGANHWYWSGCLDGVEAQFGEGWPAGQGPEAPLLVDFDLLKIHPLQLNHGMGYFTRWWSGDEAGGPAPMLLLDEYRMQEVAFGHAGFVPVGGDATLGRAWLEDNLLTPVTARYATARPVAIEYQVGDTWVDSTAAAKAAAWDRVRIRYDNGLTVVANARQAPLSAGEAVLPQYGWLAEGAGVTAYTAERQGVVVDYAETADRVFANARDPQAWEPARFARPSLLEFAPVAPRAFTVTYRWQALRELPEGETCFVHFCSRDPGGPIRFQQDHPLPTSQWKSGDTVADGPYRVELPADLPDGDYDWYIGLFDPAGGQRLGLVGPSDAENRIRIGVLSVRDQGTKITLTRAPDTSAQEARYRAHLNTAREIIDFGTVRTNGSISLRREGNEWVLHAFPRDASSVVELSSRRFPPPARIASPGGAADSVAPETSGEWWRLPLNGAAEYRW